MKLFYGYLSYNRSYNQSIDCLIYQTFYEIFQLFIDHKMANEINLCSEFLIIVEKNENEETRKIFHDNLWNYLLNKIDNQQDMMDYFVDFVIIQRKKFQMMFFSDDNDETIFEKMNLLKRKNKFLIESQVPEKGLELIQ